mmetsp:Transcript_107036/g.228561  ORF Transcript_107036/g.228561 Transcript_107036/m.228561 type:complete len:209 (+) Transcript_107036:701-1327(+)
MSASAARARRPRQGRADYSCILLHGVSHCKQGALQPRHRSLNPRLECCLPCKQRCQLLRSSGIAAPTCRCRGGSRSGTGAGCASTGSTGSASTGSASTCAAGATAACIRPAMNLRNLGSPPEGGDILLDGALGPLLTMPAFLSCGLDAQGVGCLGSNLREVVGGLAAGRRHSRCEFDGPFVLLDLQAADALSAQRREIRLPCALHDTL